MRFRFKSLHLTLANFKAYMAKIMHILTANNTERVINDGKNCHQTGDTFCAFNCLFTFALLFTFDLDPF